jgi:hypothetical protein
MIQLSRIPYSKPSSLKIDHDGCQENTRAKQGLGQDSAPLETGLHSLRGLGRVSAQSEQFCRGLRSLINVLSHAVSPCIPQVPVLPPPFPQVAAFCPSQLPTSCSSPSPLFIHSHRRRHTHSLIVLVDSGCRQRLYRHHSLLSDTSPSRIYGCGYRQNLQGLF